MSGPNFPYTALDFQQVIRQCFDETQDKLRVDATVTIGSITGEVSVEIDAADGDNIALSDGTNLVTVTQVGSRYGLDVNVLNNGALANTPNIQNISIPTANVEQSYSFPANTKKFSIRARNSSRLQISYTAGNSNTNFITILPGNIFSVEDLSSAPTIYFQASKNNELLELLSWS